MAKVRSRGNFVYLGKLAIHNTVDVDTAYYGRTSYCEFRPDMWFNNSATIRDVFEAAGYASFDCALPVDWVRSNYWNKGYDTPKGVWSYDNNGPFGEFVPLKDAYDKLEMLVNEARG